MLYESWRSEMTAGRQNCEEAARVTAIRESARAFTSIADADLEPLLLWAGQCKVVLIGEATHGTSEFYKMRQRITRQLIDEHGFNLVAIEADWPDVDRLDTYVRQLPAKKAPAGGVFRRFPKWLWRNHDMLEFVEWLRRRNDGMPSEFKASLHGLDLYSLYSSIHEVLGFLEGKDPDLARLARSRYGCILPFIDEPHTYAQKVLLRQHRGCEPEVAAMLADLLRRRIEQDMTEGHGAFDAEQNARIIRNAERYYRAMYRGAADSWNVRDRHMFETLLELMNIRGPDSKAVIWAHNSHIGDAAATQLGEMGELNLGQLVREHFDDDCCLIGFGTDTGTVAAADDWGEPVRVMKLQHSLSGSFEQLFTQTGISRFFLDLRHGTKSLKETLEESMMERAVGVIYRPETERQSHYFDARLSSQYDAYCWFEHTRAVQPLTDLELDELSPNHPYRE